MSVTGLLLPSLAMLTSKSSRFQRATGVLCCVVYLRLAMNRHTMYAKFVPYTHSTEPLYNHMAVCYMHTCARYGGLRPHASQDDKLTIPQERQNACTVISRLDQGCVRVIGIQHEYLWTSRILTAARRNRSCHLVHRICAFCSACMHSCCYVRTVRAHYRVRIEKCHELTNHPARAASRIVCQTTTTASWATILTPAALSPAAV